MRTILVETASRFARDLMVQEVGFAMLKERGIEIVAADSPTSFLDDTPTAVLIRQLLGSVAQYEKAMLVSKLKGARDRKKAQGYRVDGPKPYAETDPELIVLARKLHGYPVNGRRRSLRQVAQELPARGHLAKSGKPFSASAIKRFVEAKP